MASGDSITDETEEAVSFSPESTRRSGVAGVPITLGDGREWSLARDALFPVLDDTRDQLYNAQVLNGTYTPEEIELILVAATRLLRIAHDIPLDLAVELVRCAPSIEAVVRPVEQAIFGDGQAWRTYSVWARVSLRCNGIDPETIPAEEIPATLAALERTERAIPRAFIASYEASQRRANRRAGTV